MDEAIHIKEEVLEEEVTSSATKRKQQLAMDDTIVTAADECHTAAGNG